MDLETLNQFVASQDWHLLTYDVLLLNRTDLESLKATLGNDYAVEAWGLQILTFASYLGSPVLLNTERLWVRHILEGLAWLDKHVKQMGLMEGRE